MLISSCCMILLLRSSRINHLEARIYALAGKLQPEFAAADGDNPFENEAAGGAHQTGYSTDAWSWPIPHHEIVAEILHYRQLLEGTYL